MRGHCIIVIAEGAFEGLVDEDKQIVLEKLSATNSIKNDRNNHPPEWESSEE